MTTISASVRVECPYLRARRYLNESLTEQPDWPLPQLLELNAPIPGFPMHLAKDVDVEFTRGGDAVDADNPWKVRWTPAPGGVYPSFKGEMRVRPNSTDGTAFLDMHGSYEPPLGAAGAAFDAVLGHRIAEATIRSLIASMAADMKSRYQREHVTGAGR